MRTDDYLHRARLADTIGVAVLVGLLVLGCILLLLTTNGCTPPAEQPGADWPPEVAFESASVEGFVDIVHDGGVTRIDLSTGTVVGETAGGLTVAAWEVNTKAAVEVNGSPQSVELRSTNGVGLHCLDGTLGVMGTSVRGRWPLSPECGPAGVLEVSYRP